MLIKDTSICFNVESKSAYMYAYAIPPPLLHQVPSDQTIATIQNMPAMAKHP